MQTCYLVEDTSFWFEHRVKCIYATMENYQPQGMFLDIGGGNGFNSRYFHEKKIQTSLIEPGIDGVRNAIGRGVPNVVHARIEDLELKPGSVGAVGMFDVLEHIDKAGKCVDMLYDALKPGGLFFITVPAFTSLWSEADVHAGHFRRYKLSELKRFLNNHRFAVLYNSYLFSYLIPPILFSRAIPYRIGRRKKNTSSKPKDSPLVTNNLLTKKLLSRIHHWELNQIRTQSRIFCGSTCLAVAQKPLNG